MNDGQIRDTNRIEYEYENDINPNEKTLIGERYTLKTSMKILNLNVCGILNKLQNDVFISECLSYDILCFTESKINNVDNEKVAEVFDKCGFKIYVSNRSEMNRVRSGGIMIACKQEFTQFVTECKSKSKFIKWIRISEKATGYGANLLLGTVYIPPRQSVYACEDVYDKLEAEVVNNVQADDLVLLCGDFNSHTSCIVEDAIQGALRKIATQKYSISASMCGRVMKVSTYFII